MSLASNVHNTRLLAVINFILPAPCFYVPAKMTLMLLGAFHISSQLTESFGSVGSGFAMGFSPPLKNARDWPPLSSGCLDVWSEYMGIWRALIGECFWYHGVKQRWELWAGAGSIDLSWTGSFMKSRFYILYIAPCEINFNYSLRFFSIAQAGRWLEAAAPRWQRAAYGRSF